MLTSHRPEGELEVFVNSSNDLHIQCGRMGRGQVRGKEQEINISQVMKILCARFWDFYCI